LVRHGRVQASEEILVGRSPGIPLRPESRVTIEQLVPRLAREPIDRLYASPLERTLETARILGEALQLEVTPASEILELDFGDWTGKAFQDLDQLTSWTAFNAFRSGAKVPGGELFLATQVRAVSFLLQLRDAEPNGTFVLVTHGDIIRSILMYFLGMPADLVLRIRIDLASLSTLWVGHDAAEVKTVNWTGQ
jgi:broad specificity phosphatase PhoE